MDGALVLATVPVDGGGVQVVMYSEWHEKINQESISFFTFFINVINASL